MDGTFISSHPSVANRLCENRLERRDTPHPYVADDTEIAALVKGVPPAFRELAKFKVHSALGQKQPKLVR